MFLYILLNHQLANIMVLVPIQYNMIPHKAQLQQK